MKKLIANPKLILLLFLIFALAASVQSLLSGPSTFDSGEQEYTAYNNYEIFVHSFQHLKDGKDLYATYPDEHWDQFKYSPTFATFFGLFNAFPDWLGLTVWNLLNALLLLWGVYLLPRLSRFEKGLILLLLLIELMTSLQNEQSNGMIAGFLIFSFAMLEKRQFALAAFCIVFSAFIKLFGIVGLALFLIYPQKWKLAIYTFLSAGVLFALPLLFTDLSELQAHYVSWGNLLSADHSSSYGISVMGWLYTWFGLSVNKYLVTIAGAVIFILPYLRAKQYLHYKFRLLALSSILIWVVIFNHEAESPTFIIAMAGASIWFVISSRSHINIAMISLAILLTSLSPTDLFPAVWKHSFFQPFVIKVVPCIVIWVKVIYDMLKFNTDKQQKTYLASTSSE